MEELIKSELKSSVLKPYGQAGGGCISNGSGYMTDMGAVFVKMNEKDGASTMFKGEAASLEAILKTQTVNAPRPIKVIDTPKGGSMLVTEYVEIGSLRNGAKLGEQLARMHLHNEELKNKMEKQESSIHKSQGLTYVEKYGFDLPTCCGFIPQENGWEEDWVTFYTKKLQYQLDLVEKKYHDKEARSLWPVLMSKIPKLFSDIDVKPALLHGDLWGGNAGENDEGPVIFDAASFYGHSEYDLGITMMFGGFGSSFFNAYHKLIPKTPQFADRSELYQLFHYLNHWNHFGGGYRGQSIGIMKQLSNKL